MNPSATPTSAESLLGFAADEFTQRLHRGESPRIEEYEQRFPQIASIIRQVFPALQTIQSQALGAAAVASPTCGAGLQPAVRDHANVPGNAVAFGCLGDFRILREIGRGGMGVVYEAEQISLARRVALKVLPFAAALDAKQLQRFKNEAQAAAQLHHTNIVPVYAVGCERGVHYYAMQYIEGRSLAEVVAQAAGVAQASSLWPDRRDAGSTSFFRTAATLALQAAEALASAHEVGILHRDVKPSNLLVDLHGRLWITDFGLARMQGDPGLTLTGDLVGTLRYMSPEQALAQRVPIDHRTDVYSLGVTLYELLTLRPAFDGHDRQELLRQVAFEEPPPPRRVNPALPVELETIVLKAMNKLAAERYATAQDMADDLRRFLEDKPIHARRPTLLDRARKWSRRHRPIVTAAAVVLVLVVLGLSIGSALLWQEQQRTQAAYREARDEAEKAEQISEFLQKMLTSLNPERVEGRDLSVLIEVLDEAGKRVEAELPNQPEVRAALHTTIGRTYERLSRSAAAEHHLRAALAIRRSLFAGDHPGVATSLHDLAKLLEYQRVTGNDEARALIDEALAMRRRLFGDDHPATADSLYLWARISDRGWEARIATYQNVLAVRRKWLGNDNPDVAHTLHVIGNCLAAVDRWPEAESHYRESLEIRRRILPDNHPWLVSGPADLAGHLAMVGKVEEAVELAEEALARAQRSFPADHQLLGLALLVRGGVMLEEHRAAEAEPLLRQSVRIYENYFEEDHWRTAVAHSVLGQALVDRGCYAEAEPLLLDAYADMDHAFSADASPHYHLRNAARRIADLYEAREAAEPGNGYREKAAGWRVRLAPAGK